MELGRLGPEARLPPYWTRHLHAIMQILRGEPTHLRFEFNPGASFQRAVDAAANLAELEDRLPPAD